MINCEKCKTELILEDIYCLNYGKAVKHYEEKTLLGYMLETIIILIQNIIKYYKLIFLEDSYFSFLKRTAYDPRQALNEPVSKNGCTQLLILIAIQAAVLYSVIMSSVHTEVVLSTINNTHHEIVIDKVMAIRVFIAPRILLFSVVFFTGIYMISIVVNLLFLIMKNR